MKYMLVAAMLGVLFLFPATALADGEAGLVIDWGDGRVTDHCIAFEGDGISGDELLSRAGYSVNDFSGLVCGIQGQGCEHSGSGSSCLCECPSGGADCTYWGFFTKDAGAPDWQYSFMGYRSQAASDGDMHGWIWGRGGPSSAPPPPDVPFESVCGASASQPTAATTVSPDVTPPPVTTIPSPEPDHGDATDDSNGGGSLVLFGATAAVLAIAIVGGLIWRARRGN